MAQLDTGEPSIEDATPATASAGLLLELGIQCCTGRKVAKDYVSAHMWFNLAALKGSEDAKHYRRELALEMSPAEIAEAQKQARCWLTLH